MLLAWIAGGAELAWAHRSLCLGELGVPGRVLDLSSQIGARVAVILGKYGEWVFPPLVMALPPRAPPLSSWELSSF